jgi:hypothetical protein
MPYIIVDKTLLEVVATDPNAPHLTDPNLLAIKVTSLDGYVVRRWDQSQGEVDPETGSRPIYWGWVSGTSFPQTQVDTEVARQANQLAKMQAAVNTVIAGVNGKAVTALTTTDVRNLLAILLAEKDWINSAGKVAIPTDYKLF